MQSRLFFRSKQIAQYSWASNSTIPNSRLDASYFTPEHMVSEPRWRLHWHSRTALSFDPLLQTVFRTAYVWPLFGRSYFEVTEFSALTLWWTYDFVSKGHRRTYLTCLGNQLKLHRVFYSAQIIVNILRLLNDFGWWPSFFDFLFKSTTIATIFTLKMHVPVAENAVKLWDHGSWQKTRLCLTPVGERDAVEFILRNPERA
jgi:hypothetical protein